MSIRRPIRATAAFDLLELLVVIAVIAILATMLFPILSRARASAQRTTCMNNLRQINMGIRVYSDDSNDAAPSPGRVAGHSVTLFSGYKELMKNDVGLSGASSSRDKLFACPADHFFPGYVYTNDTSWTYIRKSLHDDPVLDYSSYAFNGGDNVARTFGGTTNPFTVTPHGLTGVKLGSVGHPARTVLVAEASALGAWSWHEPSLSRLQFNDAKSVVSFVDGHVVYLKIYWDSTHYPNGGFSLAMDYDPPAGYDYQWSAN